MDMPPPTPAQLASIEYQKAHIGDSLASVMIGVSWFMWTLALLAVALRLYAQRCVRVRFQIDDALIVISLLLATGLAIKETGETRSGAGKHLVAVTFPELVTLGKWLYAFEIMYTLAMLTVKTSILILYHRIFESKGSFRIAIWIMGAYVVGWFIATQFAQIFQCTPVAKQWDPTIPGKCLNVPQLLFITSILNTIGDAILVAMPIPFVARLQMPIGRKIAISCIFLLGGIVTIAGIMRIVTLKTYDAFDATYDTIWIGVWSVVEVCLGIVGACLPPMAPLYRKFVKSILVRYRYWTTSRSGTSDERLTTHPQAQGNVPRRTPNSISDTERTLSGTKEDGNEDHLAPPVPAAEMTRSDYKGSTTNDSQYVVETSKV